MSRPDHPSLPGVDPEVAPLPGEAGYEHWLEETAVTAEGVDRLAIWRCLNSTPGERLEHLETSVNDLLELRGGEWTEIR